MRHEKRRKAKKAASITGNAERSTGGRFVVLAPNRWKLGKGVRVVNQTLNGLRVGTTSRERLSVG